MLDTNFVRSELETVASLLDKLDQDNLCDLYETGMYEDVNQARDRCCDVLERVRRLTDSLD